jgi:hypothetical protein
MPSLSSASISDIEEMINAKIQMRINVKALTSETWLGVFFEI